MNDFINRKALCDKLREYKIAFNPNSSNELQIKGYNDGIDLAIVIISKFENKKNYWEFIGDNLFRCKKCGYIVDGQWLKNWKQKTTDNVFPDYCPNCGERMNNYE